MSHPVTPVTLVTPVTSVTSVTPVRLEKVERWALGPNLFNCDIEDILVMVVPGDSPREVREGEMLPCDGGGEVGQLYGGGGLEGGLGCGEDDEIFLLPLTALAMEADDLRWVSYNKTITEQGSIATHSKAISGLDQTESYL